MKSLDQTTLGQLYSELASEFSERDSQITSLQSDATAKDAQIADLTSQLAAASESVTSANQTTSDQAATFQQTLNEKLAQISTLQAQNADLQSQLDALRAV